MASDGHGVTPDTSRVTANRRQYDWTSSPAPDGTRELALARLRTLRAETALV
ncbi:hypothetical protein [Amycolatopsis rubida]|uniref:hypothetical protein n=1 Tax=Amycolatopsis rubida TaxID=112413 RepID=UPI001FCA83B8|nr:hypothetical protein [Amycolatopsis rubida]